MSKKLTIRDIARMAGVSVATVSRVINSSERVDSHTRKKILDLVAATGYRPSRLGRALSLNRVHSVLLQLHNAADPYCANVLKAIGHRCRDVGYGLMVGDSDYDPAIEADCLRRIGDGSVDGLIVSPLPSRNNIPLYAELASRAFPVVLIDAQIPTVDLNCVKNDDLAAARLAMDYLLGKGHRRIAFLEWKPEFPTVKDRYRGYVESHEAWGVPLAAEYRVTAPNQLGEDFFGRMKLVCDLPQPPTAILAENEIMATVCTNALLRLGKRIPADMAVVALGDLLSDSLVPVPLTAVALHHNDAMHRALDLVIELIEQPESRHKMPSVYIQKPKLIIRESA